MKKTWVALAVAGVFAAGAAQAQSSVTLYGIVDVNYMWQELPTNVGGRVQQESVSAINSGHQSGSRWGLRGSEDLGGGLKAIFTLEGGYSPDTGTLGQGGRLFGRQAWAGLSGGWGSVVAGRLATFSSGTGSFDMIGRIDPFLTGFGLASAGNTFISMNALRVDNTIAYVSPKWGGFMGGVAYSTRIDGSEVTPSGANTTAFSMGANWQSGPFFIAATYDVANQADSTPQKKDQKHFQIGGTFDLGNLRLHAGYADQSNIGAIPSLQGGTGSFLAVPAGLQFDNVAWLLGATYKMGNWAFMGSYQAANADGQRIGTVNYEPDYNVYGVGATYNFSRRTNIYASYAARDANGTLIDNAFNAKQLAIGMRHLF